MRSIRTVRGAASRVPKVAVRRPILHGSSPDSLSHSARGAAGGSVRRDRAACGPKPERRVRGPESCGLPCRRAIRPIAPRSSRPDRAGSSRFPAGRNCARFSVAVRLLRSRGRNRPERALGSAGRKRSRPTDMRLRAKRRGAQVFFSWQYRFRQLVRISGYSVLNRRISSFSSFR